VHPAAGELRFAYPCIAEFAGDDARYPATMAGWHEGGGDHEGGGTLAKLRAALARTGKRERVPCMVKPPGGQQRR
jgi:hypothetical protein